MAATCLLTATIACRSSTAPQPSAVSGLVTALTPQDTAVLVLVERRSESPLYLRVGQGTTVTVRKLYGQSHAGSYRDIRSGDSIEAERSVVELRSNPPQYYATRVSVQRQ
jgi:hypothetical protein